MKERFTLAVLLTLALSMASLSQTAHEIYQQGLVQAQASGNLKEAIKLYSQALKSAGNDRDLAARVLIQIGNAQEKLGQPAEAVSAYSELIRTYPEQREQTALAQQRLDALRPKAAGSSQYDVSALTGPLFQNYCASCHNATNKAGGLDLASLNAKNVGENTAIWENLLRRLRARRDPPVGLTRPDERTYQSLITKLEVALDGAYPANRAAADESVSDSELATRLAAFLWGSTPDSSLLEDARRGKLHEPGVLDRQVQRMLRDSRSSALVSGFFVPWLSLDRLKKSPEDPGLVQSMETETRMFLESQLRENHNALDLWTANYTFLNEDLARHYGIQKISGKEFRRVTWPDNKRAGILGQAGLLTALSSSSRTSPTSRGLFVFTKFLGNDAVPPPANVPPLGNTAADQARTMRERVIAHRIVPACANCHVMFDPLGLALENFDATGQWRTTDGGQPIDASGTFIDGTSFDGPAQLRAGMVKYRDAYYANLTQQLLAYAMNRKVRRVYDYEMPSVRAIVRKAAAEDYRWSAILSGIVSSAPFQAKDLVP